MIIANRLKNESWAEFLLYMWQIEDIIRAYDCDIDRLSENYLTRFEVDEQTKKELTQWYAYLCNMMIEENLKHSGHMQINKNILADLNELHNKLLNSPKFPFYKELYYKVLPYIIELRKKNINSINEFTELEVCFNALYGYMILKLKHENISSETMDAIKNISTLLGQLSDYHKRDKVEPIDFD